MSRWDVLVVGSGVGGLTAALTAAMRGRSVLVLEGAKQLGGLLNPFKRGAYRFDPGVHYLGECGEGQTLRTLFEALGVEVCFRELSPEGFDRLVFPGYEVSMPRGLGAYEARLRADFPKQERGLRDFFNTVREFHDAAAAWQTLGDPGSPPAFFARHAGTTYGQLLASHFEDPMLRAVLAAQAGNYALPPARASALVGLGVLDHYLGGAYFPVGGAGAMRDALVQRIRALGGELLENHVVTRIELKAGRVQGVTCANGARFEARVVVSNVDASTTFLDLLPRDAVPQRLRAKAASLTPSLGSLNLFVGTRLDLSKAMTDANIWHYDTLDINAVYAPALRGEIGTGAFFVAAPGLKEGAPSPATLIVVAIAPYSPFEAWKGERAMRRGEDYDAFKDRLAETYLTRLERYVPGIRGNVDVLELATPVTNAFYTGARAGGMYGPEQTPAQSGPFRQRIDSKIPGLYFCGASTLGAGVVPCAMSGWIAGQRV